MSLPTLTILVQTLHHRARCGSLRNCDITNSFLSSRISTILIRIIAQHTSYHISGTAQRGACNQLSSVDSSGDRTSTALVTSTDPSIAPFAYAPTPLSWAFYLFQQSPPPHINCSPPCTNSHTMLSELLFLAPMPHLLVPIVFIHLSSSVVTPILSF